MKLWTILLLCPVLLSPIYSQKSAGLHDLTKATNEYYNRNFTKSLELSKSILAKAQKTKNTVLVFKSLDIIASSQISLGNYEDAEATLNKSLNLLSGDWQSTHHKANINLRLAWLYRNQYKFEQALKFSKKAAELLPDNKHIRAEHYLNVGRILFASGYDASAIIWLEKADSIFAKEANSVAKFDTLQYLALAWSSKLNYAAAINYSSRLADLAEHTQFKQKYRQALFDLATVTSSTGQQKKVFSLLQKGLEISDKQGDSYDSCKFLTSLLLETLYATDLPAAIYYLEQLQAKDKNKQFDFEVKLGKAVLAAFRGDVRTATYLFSELEKKKLTSEFIIPNWKIITAKRNNDWQQVLTINSQLLDLVLKSNFREDLPYIYFNFAEAHFHLNQITEALSYLDKVIAIIEEVRMDNNANLSINLFDTHHNAYRLYSQIKISNPEEALEYAERLKSRFLKDKINNSIFQRQFNISPEVRKTLEKLTAAFVDNSSEVGAEIAKYEQSLTIAIPTEVIPNTDFGMLDKISELDNTAIISYLFTLDKKLLAFVWQKNKLLRVVRLPILEEEVFALAKTAEYKIKQTIFFKKDGKELFDKLLKPLDISADHIIIVPDKVLWKIPFQALSSDGQKYLIEDKVISYAPSLGVLIGYLQAPKTSRQTLKAFANSFYERKFLANVNTEAKVISALYQTTPVLNATTNDFLVLGRQPDIVHFSMHAEVDSEQPLNSFLAFKPLGKNNGRLTVDDLLTMHLKRGSLVFLASCDTNNVYNGEGLVSLTWGMMGAGATTVIAANWEADDRSTKAFTENFYHNYKKGYGVAKALQQTAINLINGDSSEFREPYYWAQFTLNGDFR